ncbi:hypothetical protein LTR28_005745 [Elasticomyces elasticus]|nr:hypothetical protein LTR28_005745 [Elasticomyces elasticus]
MTSKAHASLSWFSSGRRRGTDKQQFPLKDSLAKNQKQAHSRTKPTKKPGYEKIEKPEPQNESDSGSEVHEKSRALGNTTNEGNTSPKHALPGETPDEYAAIMLSEEETDSVLGTESFALVAAFASALKLSNEDERRLANANSLFVSLPTSYENTANFLRPGQKILNIARPYNAVETIASGSS